MKSRRDFLKTSALISAAALTGVTNMKSNGEKYQFKSKRPPLRERKFISEAVENKILSTRAKIGDEELAWMFENCYPNTLDTTVKHGMLNGKLDTFVITGDINAMWLRDSTAQVWPYLPLINEDEKLKNLIVGVIHRQVRSILIDPYANAFNFSDEGSYWESDHTEMKKELHERKWEIDSLCYPLRLSYGYWERTNDASPFDNDWFEALKVIVETFRIQSGEKTKSNYKFQRTTANATDTQPLGGYGNPTKPCGLINSSFRPSDDATIYSFLIPSNLFAVKVLTDISKMLKVISPDSELIPKIRSLTQSINSALNKFAIREHLTYGKIYAYEVDGFGNSLFMDDANIPSLLSLPYLGACKIDDEIYLRTRKFLLSDSNPYFFKGKYAEGIGGPHVGLDMIWPMSLIMRALTSEDDIEISECLQMLKTTHAGTGFMHESFNKDNPDDYTRSWFAWANTLFGELIIKLVDERPHLLK